MCTVVVRGDDSPDPPRDGSSLWYQCPSSALTPQTHTCPPACHPCCCLACCAVGVGVPCGSANHLHVQLHDVGIVPSGVLAQWLAHHWYYRWGWTRDGTRGTLFWLTWACPCAGAPWCPSVPSLRACDGCGWFEVGWEGGLTGSRGVLSPRRRGLSPRWPPRCMEMCVCVCVSQGVFVCMCVYGVCV